MYNYNINCSINITKNENNIFYIQIDKIENEEIKSEVNDFLSNVYNLYNQFYNNIDNSNIEYNEQLIINQYNDRIKKLETLIEDKNQEIKIVKSQYDSINQSFDSIINKQVESKLQNELFLQNNKNENEINKIINKNQINLFQEINKNSVLQNEIEYLKSQIERLNENFQHNLDIKTQSIQNQHSNTINQLQCQLQLYKSQIDDNINLQNINNQICDVKKSLNSEIQNISKYFNNKDNNISGECGEVFIYDYLKSIFHFGDFQIERVNGKSNAGDIFLKYNNIKCCIESKNHALSIRQEHINRFINTDIANPNYNSGIFISFKSDFVNCSNIKHFDIQFKHDKPIIFLSKFVNQKEHIILAIRVIEFILFQQENNKQTDINKYINLLQTNIKTINSIIDINNNINKQLIDSNKLLNTQIASINQILNITNTNHENYKYHCQKCSYKTNKKIDFNKHHKLC